MKKNGAPKAKTGPTPKTIKEGQPKAVRLQYAIATGESPAIGKNPSTYDKKSRGK